MKIDFRQIINSMISAAVMFCFVYAGLIIWGAYRPEIRTALRTAQNMIFG